MCIKYDGWVGGHAYWQVCGWIFKWQLCGRIIVLGTVSVDLRVAVAWAYIRVGQV